MDTYVRSDLDQSKIWKIIFSHGWSPVCGQASSAGHCWHLQEVLFPRPLLYPLLWNLVAQSLPAHGLTGRTMAGCCPSPPGTSSTGWSWFEALLHSSWLTVSTCGSSWQALGRDVTQHSWLGPSPVLHWHPAQWQVGSCQGAHDPRPFAARPTGKST